MILIFKLSAKDIDPCCLNRKEIDAKFAKSRLFDYEINVIHSRMEIREIRKRKSFRCTLWWLPIFRKRIPELAFAYDFVQCQRHRSHPQKDSGHLVKCYFVSHKKSVGVPHRQAVTSQSAFSNGQTFAPRDFGGREEGRRRMARNSVMSLILRSAMLFLRIHLSKEHINVYKYTYNQISLLNSYSL